MKTYAMALDLIDDPEVIEEYKEHHRHVWLEVKQGLEEIGILEMKIFLVGCRLFMFLRTEDEFDLEKDFQRYTDTSPRARMWDELMRNFQQKIPSARIGDWWAPMEEVFNLE